MEKVRIKLVSLGDTKTFVDLSKVAEHVSKVFEVTYSDSVRVLPDAEGKGWSYSDSQLKHIVSPDPNFDVTIAVLQPEIENNYYLRILENGVCVVSLHEMAEFCEAANIPVKNYILKCIYLEALRFYRRGRVANGRLSHHETRGCIFDMNPYKFDIVRACDGMKICAQCQAILAEVQLPVRTFDVLLKELSRIRKPLYYRISDWVKRHPVLSIAITICGGAISAALGRFIYDVGKYFVLG